MRICLFEDAGVENLEPLTLMRPAFDLRCGALSLLERQQRALPRGSTGALVRAELADLCRMNHAKLHVNDAAWLGERTAEERIVLVNARWLAPAEVVGPWTSCAVGLAGEQVAYAVVPAAEAIGLSLDNLDRRLAQWTQTLPHREAGGSVLDHPWDLVERSAAALADHHRAWEAAGVPRAQGVTIRGPVEHCLAAPTADIEPMVLIDTTKGPVLIDDGAIVQAFSRLEGPCYVGPGTHLLGARVRGSSIGPQCRIGGEVEASIVHGFSNKAHDGFLGHSYVGEWVNFGAGTHTSDLRTDYAPVRMPAGEQTIDTGLLKVGSFVGDYVTTSLNTLFNSGTLVGAFGQLLMPGTLLPRRLPSFCRCAGGRLHERASLREVLATASAMMARRGREWTEAHTERFFTLFEETAAQRRQLLRDSEQRLRRVV